jgi:5-methylcytosine-specific restriction protein A
MCSYPRCPNLSRGGMCDEHKRRAKRERDRRAGGSRQRGYTAAWAEFSRSYRRLNPLCAQCLREGRTTAAEAVDHVVPLRETGRLIDESNLESLCASCHGKKSNRERRARSR